MNKAVRYAVIIAVSAFLTGQTFAPYYEADASRDSCAATHTHHATVVRGIAADPDRDGPHPGQQAFCCHQQSLLHVATYETAPLLTIALLPAGIVQPLVSECYSEMLLAVLVPPG